jgi:hypothetical protein
MTQYNLKRALQGIILPTDTDNFPCQCKNRFDKTSRAKNFSMTQYNLKHALQRFILPTDTDTDTRTDTPYGPHFSPR